MAPAQSKMKWVAAGSAGLLVAYALSRYLKSTSTPPAKVDTTTAALRAREESEKKKKLAKERVGVDGVFFNRLMKLLRILIPGPFCAEAGFVALVAAMLVARTYCDLWMISNNTKIERIIISRNAAAFPKSLAGFLIAMLPISLVNNVLKYGLCELQLRFRQRLTDHLYKEYLKGFTYYKISNLDNRIANSDQLLTQDVDKFCQSITDLYSNISKPVLDIIIYANKLSGAIGAQGPGYMLAYLAVSGLALTAIRKPLARFTIQEQRLEGEFRFVNSRLITNSEEVAFYQGNAREATNISSTFNRLVAHLRSAMRFRFSIGIFDHMIGKYLATVVGFFVVSRPFLDPNDPRHLNSTHDQIMEDYYLSGRMLMSLAMAVGRLILAGRELTRLAGFTARMTELVDVLKDLNDGNYERTMVKTSSSKSLDGSGDSAIDNNDDDLGPNKGTICETDHLIRFEGVPLVTPNADVLVRNMNFEVKSGMNVLVCGPNGCGKSSLFRILGELWPLFGGKLTKPAPSKLFYVPQRPYMTLGTFRDQIIYPHSQEDMARAGITDKDLEKYLEWVHLSYLVDREGGWNSVQDWMDVLSGGEKQRVAMSRLFYHKPQFAILDECTSAVSVDVEGAMYNRSRELNITLFTVSHRKSLWKYHEHVLQFDGRGAYSFTAITDATEWGS
eukprot:TRINITY_DN9359_c0_g1_i1.p1 TRINITY_DN9359_c0_g1~~TRINITY_DN9359_c0_g1_i1.p1  ORF type:complete len:672 (+),score=134.31 TRINITY_DN9359_c0_g1_i1:36-2051(+)